MARVRAAAVRREIVRACRRLDLKGHLAGAEGNVSARLGLRVVVTPAGCRKADVTAAMLVETTLDGRPTGRGEKASSELQMHLAIYRARPDVGAVVHAHPVAATGFAVARKAFPGRSLAEVPGVIGPVPLVAYRPPGTAALGAAVAKALNGANVALLASHGAVAVGPTIDVALQRMESLEQAARTVVVARILGGERNLKAAEVRALERAWNAGA
jgi:L-fuculose-phosphate aldolase